MRGDSVVVKLSDRVVVLWEAPALKGWLVNIYLDEIGQLFDEHPSMASAFGVPKFCWLVDEILSGLSSSGSVDHNDFLQDPERLEELIIGTDSEIYKLQSQTPLEHGPDDELLLEKNLRLKESGDDMGDLMAKLIAMEGSALGAIAIADRFGMNSISAMLEGISELRRDPKERLEDWKAERLQEELHKLKEDDPDAYYEGIGLEPID